MNSYTDTLSGSRNRRRLAMAWGPAGFHSRNIRPKATALLRAWLCHSLDSERLRSDLQTSSISDFQMYWCFLMIVWWCLMILDLNPLSWWRHLQRWAAVLESWWAPPETPAEKGGRPVGYKVKNGNRWPGKNACLREVTPYILSI